MIVERMKRRNPGADYDGAVSQMKKLSEERIKRSNLFGWDFSNLVIPNGSEKGYEFSTAHFVKSLGDFANPNSTDSPIMKPDAYKQYRSQIAQTFDIVRQEIYRFMEFTTKPSN